VDINGYSLATDPNSDVGCENAFPNQRTGTCTSRALTALNVVDTSRVAQRKFQQTVYQKTIPSIPPTEDSLKGISREDVVGFHQGHYRPDLTVLTLVGTTLRQCDRLENKLQSWQASGKPQV